MICPICGATIYPQRPLEYIYCPVCEHRMDPDDVEVKE